MKKTIFIFLLSVALFSCSEGMKKFDAKSSAGATVTKEEMFALTLTENHAAGQTWSIQPVWDENIIEYQKSIYNGKESGKTDFIFLAKKSGSTRVLFKLIEYSDVTDSVTVSIKVN